MSGSVNVAGVQPPIPDWGEADPGDLDTYYLDMSEWAEARNNDPPSGAITVSITPADASFTTSTASFVTGPQFAIGAIAWQAQGGTRNTQYRVQFRFMTAAGKGPFNRSCRLKVVPR